jgi:hypothetical protein
LAFVLQIVQMYFFSAFQVSSRQFLFFKNAKF